MSRVIKNLFLTLFLIFIFSISLFSKDSVEDLVSFQNAFVEVAKKVEPAVVRISTSRIVKVRRYSPFGDLRKWFEEKGLPFSEDDFFDFWFDVPTPERKYKEQGLGSGIIIDEGGYVLTNEHVVSGAEEIKITLPDKREFIGKIKGSDSDTDIAILKIEPKGKIPVAKLGDSDKLKVGMWAIAIGNPFAGQFEEKISLQPTVTVGVISALHRSIQVQGKNYEELIQTDASINPGNSGGPLVNIQGEVIGLNTAIFSPISANIGIGFAIPINKAKEVLGELINKGKIARGYLGVNPQDLTPDLAKKLGLSGTEGVLVVEVGENTPAEKAGLKEKDVILEIDGQKVTSASELRKIIVKKQPGTNVKLLIFRNKQKKQIVVKIGERPEENLTEEQNKSWKGLIVGEITEEIAKSLRLRKKQGVIVKNVEPKSVAEFAGIEIGDIIIEIKNKEIKNLSNYLSVIKEIKDDEKVMIKIFSRGRLKYVVI